MLHNFIYMRAILALTAVVTLGLGVSPTQAQIKIVGQNSNSSTPSVVLPAIPSRGTTLTVSVPKVASPKIINSGVNDGITVMGAPVPKVAAPRAKYEPVGNKVYHGASLPDAWSENGLRHQIADYNAAAGKKISVVTWFASAYEKGRMTSWSQSYVPNLARVQRLGAVSLIKFSTQDYAWDQTHKMAELKAIGRGTWDEYFKQAALAVKGFGGPVFISIDHEMNGNWYPYSQAYPGADTTAADYVAAWQRIVTIFNQNGANNVAWVWSPNVPDVGGVGYEAYYPGDSYVDWVGVSLYSGNDPTAMDDIYQKYSAKKPFFITEWATAPEKNRFNPQFPGEVAWVKEFFDSLNERYPRVKAISWFNWNQGDGDYRLQRVPEQAKAYAGDVAAPRYLDSAGDLVADKTQPALPRIDTPGREVILQDAIPIVDPKPQAAPIKRTLLDRVRIQTVPTQQ